MQSSRMPGRMVVARRAGQPRDNSSGAGKSAVGGRSEIDSSDAVQGEAIFFRTASLRQGEPEDETETETIGKKTSALPALRKNHVDRCRSSHVSQVPAP